MLKKGYIVFILFFSLFLCACGTPKQKKRTQVELLHLLKKAEKYFKNGQYEIASQYYEKVMNLFPGTPQAVLARLRIADCKFMQGDYLSAIDLYENFEKFYPANEAIPYVIFQIGNCYYQLVLPYDRDQSFTKKAIENYLRLLENFPKNPYRVEVKKRIKKLREILAHHEFYVARFYYKMKYYRSAYNRLLYLLNNYPETLYAKKARKLVYKYYKMALKETEELREGKKKDFWGEPVP